MCDLFNLVECCHCCCYYCLYDYEPNKCYYLKLCFYFSLKTQNEYTKITYSDTHRTHSSYRNHEFHKQIFLRLVLHFWLKIWIQIHVMTWNGQRFSFVKYQKGTQRVNDLNYFCNHSRDKNLIDFKFNVARNDIKPHPPTITISTSHLCTLSRLCLMYMLHLSLPVCVVCTCYTNPTYICVVCTYMLHNHYL